MNISTLFKSMNLTFWLMLERVVQVFSTLLLSFCIAKTMSIDLFGEWQLAQTYLFFLTAFVNVASFEITVPFVKQFQNLELIIFGVALRFRLLAVFFCSVLALAPILIFLKLYSFLILLMFFLPLLIREPLSAIVMMLISRAFTKQYITISFLSLTLKILITLLIYNKLTLSIYYFTIPLYVENFVYICLLIKVKTDFGVFLNTKLPSQINQLFINRCMWGWLYSITLVITLRVDRLCISFLASINDFAYYAAAAQIGDNWYYFGTIFANVFTSTYLSNDDGNMRKIIKVMLISVLALLFISAIISFYANEIIALLYGENLKPAAPLLIANTWVSVLVPIEMLMNTLLLYQGRLKFSVFKGILSLSVIPVLIYSLFPYLGLYSGALAIGICLVLKIVLNIFYLWGGNSYPRSVLGITSAGAKANIHN